MANSAQYAPAHTRFEKIGPYLMLLIPALGLCLLGLLVLYSAGRGELSGASLYMKKQLVWLPLAVTGMLIVWRLNLEKLRKFAPWIALAGIVLLLAVLVPGIGKKVNGARRWIDLGPMNMQVSDLVKIIMVYVLAHYLAANQRYLTTFVRGFLLPCSMFGTVFILILLQPDYGTAVLCASVGASMLFLAGARMLYLVPTALLGGALFALAVYLDPVRLKRILSFLDIEANKADGAYQLWQGILAFGTGGITGVGLGNGRQQMAFLPEAHTDFIFPIIGEELGFVFTLLVVIAFVVITFTVIRNLARASNLFQFLLAVGALLLIVFQALINFGVVTGLLPTKGMSLPFISYGGSNLIAMFLCLGIIMNCFRVWNEAPLKRATEIDF